MTVKMGRSEWLSVVMASLQGGSTIESSMVSADTAIKVADTTFGTLEALDQKQDDEDTARIIGKVDKLAPMIEEWVERLTKAASPPCPPYFDVNPDAAFERPKDETKPTPKASTSGAKVSYG